MSTAASNARSRVQAAIEEQLPVLSQPDSAGPWYVGFSGGMDSTVLLHALSAHTRRHADPIAVIALHLDHGLHGDSAQWLTHCRSVCEALQVRLISEQLPDTALHATGGGLEAAARTARYEFFSRHVRRPGELLLLAHHADDQAETLLLRQVQGRGVLPMPAVRTLGEAQLRRPLLPLPRTVLAEYAQLEGLRWIEDPANQSLQMDRNYLRHAVWPNLNSRWPRAAVHLQRVADTVGHTETALSRVLAEHASLPVHWCEGAAGVALLRAWLAQFEEFTATDRALSEFARQLSSPGDRGPRLQLQQGSLVRANGQVLYESAD